MRPFAYDCRREDLMLFSYLALYHKTFPPIWLTVSSATVLDLPKSNISS